MQELIEAARAVIASWAHGDLAGTVNALDGVLARLPEPTPATPEQIRVAKDYTGWTDELRFDEGAEISLADNGHWIAAWQWIPADDAD